jgi:hypothetical protein
MIRTIALVPLGAVLALGACASTGTTYSGYTYGADYGYAPAYPAYAPAYFAPSDVGFGFGSGYRWHDHDDWRGRGWRGGDWHGGGAHWQEQRRGGAAAPAPASAPRFPNGGGGSRAPAAAPVQAEPHRDGYTSESGR